MTVDYIQLITNAHADKPKFVATVQLLTDAVTAVTQVAQSLVEVFSVDAAIGVQLDKVGLWVGISRLQRVPITGAFFTWDDADLGWNRANWKGPFEPTEGITELDDDTYRAVIKAKIGSNYWNGTDLALNDIGQTAFAELGVYCFVLDNLDMSTTVYITGFPTQALIELIKRGIAPPKTAGVKVNGYILASAPGAPFFALSVPTTSEVAGLDFGSFGDPV